jgi:hypothetical protein
MATLTPDQIRHLATKAGVCPDTVRRFVRGQEVRRDNREKLLATLRAPECAHLGWLLRRHGS